MENNRITKWGRLAQEAVEQAIKENHEKGISTYHADKNGVYELKPNGQKVYIRGQNERQR